MIISPRASARLATLLMCAGLVGASPCTAAAPQVPRLRAAASYGVGAYGPPHALAVADLDRDGHDDVIVATCDDQLTCGTVEVFLAGGGGVLRGPLALPAGGNGVTAIAVADVDGDGRLDLVVSHFASDTIGILAGRGDGTFDAARTVRSVADSTAAGGPVGLAVADLDADGHADIAVGHAQSRTDGSRALSVLYGQGDLRFDAPVALASGGIGCRTVAAADVNRDGVLDLVVTNDWAAFGDTRHSTVSVLTGAGHRQFASARPVRVDGWGAAAAAVADVDGDGELDVLATSSQPRGVQVLGGHGGVLDRPVLVPVGGVDGNLETRAGTVALADVTGDGVPDVLTGTCFGQHCAGSLFVLPGQRGSGVGTPIALDVNGGGAGLVASGDIDGDGLDDAVVATCVDWSCSSGSVAVLLQDASLSDTTARASAAAATPVADSLSLDASALDAGAAVYNLKVVTDASPDLTDLASYVRSTTSRWSSSAEKVWALFYWSHMLRRQTSPIVLHGFEVTDPIRNFLDFGFTMCSTATGINQVLFEAIGLPHEYWDICNHTVANVEYDGRWHMIDNSMSNLVTLDDGVTLASVSEASADGARLVRMHSLYATSPNGFLTGSDTLRNLVDTVSPVDGKTLQGFSDDFCSTGLKKRDYYYNWNAGHRFVLNLRQGERYTRYARPLGTSADYWVGSEQIANANPASTFQNDASNKFGLHGNGTWSFTPSLAADAYDRALYAASNLAPAAAGGLAPATPEAAADAIYKVQAADIISSQRITAEFARKDPSATAVVALSLNHGRSWIDVGTVGSLTGTVPLVVNLRNEVNGAYETLVRVRMTTTAGDPAGIRLTSLSIQTITHLNAKALPALSLGRNEIHVDAGPQSDTMVLWPDLRGTLWQKDAFDAQNIASQDVSVPRKYTAVVYPASLKQDAYLVYKLDAPTDVASVTYGGRLYNYTQGSYIDFLHSFDGGATWTRSYRLSTVAAPYDVIHYETVVVPAGVRSVLFKYLIHNTGATALRASGLYAVRMEVNHQPAAAASAPVDVTWRWKEVQADRTTVTRSHTQRIDSYPTRYVVNVGGQDLPQLESIEVAPASPSAPAGYGYSDGVDAGGEKFVPSQRLEGVNLALNRPYTVSLAPTVFQGSAGATNTVILTDGVIGAPMTGNVSYWWGQCWKANQNVVLQVDLGDVQQVGAVRAHLFGYTYWDALKGQVQDRVEIETSIDGVTFTSQGALPTAVWRRDVPVNYMLLDDGSATAWNFERRLPAPVQARYVRYRMTPKRSYLCASELQVFDRVEYVPFDMRIALPALPGEPPADQTLLVAVVLPVGGASVPAGTTMTLAATATETDAIVTHVEFLVDDLVVGTDTTAPWSISWVPSPEGAHVITARAYDDAGDVATSTPVSISVIARSNVPPDVVRTAPAAGSTVTAGDSVALAADASDRDGTVTHVEFLVDGAVVSDATVAPWVARWTAAGAGSHALSARAYDDAGGVSTSLPRSVTVEVVRIAGEDVVVWASDAPIVSGWILTADTGAAGGARLQSPDLGVAKLATALASPTQYFELTFNALAGRGYRLWIRGKAQANSYTNDSVFLQFDHSVDAGGAPVFRIGTTSATTYSIEDCSGCGLSGWGWADNGYGTNGSLLYFDTSGPQRVRVQVREDGIGIDQIVLSSAQWSTQPPGATKNDTVILDRTDLQGSGNAPPAVQMTSPGSGATFTVGAVVPLSATASDADGAVVRVEFLVDGTSVATASAAPWTASWTADAVGPHALTARAYDDAGAASASAPVSITVQAPVVPGEDVVVWAAESTSVAGWVRTTDASAASGARLQTPDLGAAKLATPLASPTQYFDLTFYAVAGRGYRLWLRGQAQANNYANDSVYLQFDQSVDAAGAPVYRIGTTSATTYSVEDCSGCGLSGWGWADNAYGGNGALIYFATSGMQRLRVQVREDGVGIDQVVLSSSAWVTRSPGATKNDQVVLPKTDSQ